MATVTAIIDGTGSIGAAVGPFMAGAIPGNDTQDQLNNVFYMLMGADVVSLIVRPFSSTESIVENLFWLCLKMQNLYGYPFSFSYLQDWFTKR